ncbi:unnamed protein product [Urochloa humidicola]
MDVESGSDDTARGGGADKRRHQYCSWVAAPPELEPPEAVRRRWRRPSWGCVTIKRALLLPAAVFLVAAVVVLFAGGGSLEGIPNSLLFFHDDQVNLTADHLLDGLLTADFSYRSCRSRYEFAAYHKKSPHKPSRHHPTSSPSSGSKKLSRSDAAPARPRTRRRSGVFNPPATAAPPLPTSARNAGTS